MENTEKVPHDPGWNDPPMFSYDSHAAQIKQEKRGNLLNKRVAFPIQNDGPKNDVNRPPQALNASSLPPSTIPACPSAVPLFIPPTGKPKEINSEETEHKEIDYEESNFNEDDALSSVLNNLNSALDDKTELQEKVAEIRKRIDMIEKLWKDGKFSTIIKQKIFKLSEAIISHDFDTANHIQRGLTIDHSAVCNSWMSGIRQLIATFDWTKYDEEYFSAEEDLNIFQQDRLESVLVERNKPESLPMMREVAELIIEKEKCDNSKEKPQKNCQPVPNQCSNEVSETRKSLIKDILNEILADDTFHDFLETQIKEKIGIAKTETLVGNIDKS